MTSYIESKTQDGKILRIEVEPTTKGVGFGHKATSVEGTALAAAYQQTMQTIEICAAGFVETLQSLPVPPQNAAINFAIKIDSEAGAMVAKSGENAQFKVSLSWKQPEPEKDKAAE
jgi:hypothetical protein